MLLVVILILEPTSLTDKPSVIINVFALADAVPLVVSTQVIVFVVDDVLIIFAGASKLPLASTGISNFNPILL